ncbi:MAG TPA: DUF2490 domain-containing protein [Bacteroidales bacterium]|nr:DUF2490 domain-containing protein [Bacteroidales bacterium]
MKSKRLLCFCAGLLLISLSYSQRTDLGIWYNLSADQKLTRKIDLNIILTLRTDENASRVEEGFMEGGLSYSLSKYISLAGKYRFTADRRSDGFYGASHKWFGDLNGFIRPGNFGLSGRLRYQRSYGISPGKENIGYEGSHLRYLAKAVYLNSALPIDPFIYAEFFDPLDDNCNKTFDKTRLSAGVDYKTRKKNMFEAGYILQQNKRNEIFHIISITYNLKF